MISNKCPILQKIVGTDVMRKPNLLQLFMILYMKLSDRDVVVNTADGEMIAKPGTVIISTYKFAEVLKVTRTSVTRYLNTLTELGIIKCSDLGKSGTLVTFVTTTKTGSYTLNDSPKDQHFTGTNDRNMCPSSVPVEKTGSAVVPTVAAGCVTGTVLENSTGKSSSSYLTSYEVRKDNISHARIGGEDEGMKAACEGGNKVAQVQGPLFSEGSPTPSRSQEGPQKSGVVPCSAPTPSPSPASPVLGAAGRLKAQRLQERESEEQKAKGISVSESCDRACAPASAPTGTTVRPIISLSCPPASSKLKTATSKRTSKAKFPPSTIENKLAQQLIDLILSEMPDNKTANAAYATTWAHTISSMIEEDNRDPVEIEAVLNYVGNDDRWNIRTILRADRFRTQYDRLALAYRTRKGAVKSRTQSSTSTPQSVINKQEESSARLARLQAEHAEKMAALGGVQQPRPGAEFGF